MIGNSQNLDIVQRIAKALARASEPRTPAAEFRFPFTSKIHSVIDWCPYYLRHLFNLMEEVAKETGTDYKSIKMSPFDLNNVLWMFFLCAYTQYTDASEPATTKSRRVTGADQKLDITQRLVEALARTGEPGIPVVDDFKPEGSTVIGEVPRRLRHGFNLLEEFYKEALVNEQQTNEASMRHNALEGILLAALIQNVSCVEDEYGGILVCSDWQVVGISHT